MKEPIIYLDLDETLLSTVVRRDKGNGGRTWLKLSCGNWYGSMKRPGVHDFIQFCRDLAPTKILTTAAYDYPQAFIDEFEFGFPPEDVISRYDYVIEDVTSGGWGMDRTETRVINHRHEPNAILVDNLWPESNERKMEYLGIGPDRYIKIRDYFGGKEPQRFDNELDIIKSKIKQLVEGARD